MSYLLQNIKKYLLIFFVLVFLITLSSCELYYKYSISKQINEIKELEATFNNKLYNNKSYKQIIEQYDLKNCVLLHNKTSRILTQSIYNVQNKYKNYCILNNNIVQALQTPNYNKDYKIAITNNISSLTYFYFYSLNDNTIPLSEILFGFYSIENFYNKDNGIIDNILIENEKLDNLVNFSIDNDNIIKAESSNYFIILNDKTPTNAFLQPTILQLDNIVELRDTKKTHYLYSFKNLKDEIDENFINDYLLIQQKIVFLFMIYNINYHNYKK